MNQTAAPVRQYYPALDGLRGVAILLVLLYHNFSFTGKFFFGWLGVDLFFVLSGFLITGILLKSKEHLHYFRNFYIKRVLRIFPLYYFILILFFIVFPLLHFYQNNMQFYNKHQAWFWLFLQNWLLALNFPTQGTHVLNHLWSLAVEEQFYFMWPLIIFFLQKLRLLLIVIISILLLAIILRTIIWSLHLTNFNYVVFYTFTRIDGICIGSMVAIMQKINANFITNRLALIVFGFACFNFLFYFLNEPYGILPYLALCGYTTFTLLFGIVINEIVVGNSKLLNNILNFTPLTFVGKVSYGLYIFHWPIYCIFSPFIEAWIKKTIDLSGPTMQVVSSILCVLIAFLISVLSYYFFEKKFLKLKEKLQ